MSVGSRPREILPQMMEALVSIAVASKIDPGPTLRTKKWVRQDELLWLSLVESFGAKYELVLEMILTSILGA